jgi:putative ABC transport system substrate-binding protein
MFGIRRRSLVSLALASGTVGKASAQTDRQARIGMMATAPPAPSTQPLFDAFTAGLAENGLVVGRDVTLEYRYHGGDPARMADVAEELAAMKVDVIFAAATQQALAAKKATAIIPIVFAGPGDPVGAGLVASLAHPGGNITGVSSQGVDLATKQLQYMLQAVPGATRVAVLLQPGNPPHDTGIKQLRQQGELKKIEITAIPALVPGDIEPAFDRVTALEAEALIVFDGPFASVNRAHLIELATSRKLPNLWQWRYYVQQGALMSFGPLLPDMIRRAAGYAARILKGAHPGDLPVEQPTRFELVINLRTAKALGLTVPPSLLAAADKVIE